jgi:hypothetical protein
VPRDRAVTQIAWTEPCFWQSQNRKVPRIRSVPVFHRSTLAGRRVNHRLSQRDEPNLKCEEPNISSQGEETRDDQRVAF